MADLSRDQQRAELHRTIWGFAEDARNAIDAWDFKQFVLGMLFYRFLSEDFANYIDEGERDAGDLDFSYAELSDEDAMSDEAEINDLIREKGCFIKPSQLFCNMWAFAKELDGKNQLESSNLNTMMNNALREIVSSSVGVEGAEGAEEAFEGLFDDFDTSSTRLGKTVADRNKRILQLMDGIGNMDLGDTEDARVDLLATPTSS